MSHKSWIQHLHFQPSKTITCPPKFSPQDKILHVHGYWRWVLARRIDMHCLRIQSMREREYFWCLQPRNVMECVFSVVSKCFYFSGLVLGLGSHFRYWKQWQEKYFQNGLGKKWLLSGQIEVRPVMELVSIALEGSWGQWWSQTMWSGQCL